MKLRSSFSWALLVTLLALAPQGAAEAAPDGEESAKFEWSDVSRVVAVGDLHGSYDKAVRLFQGVGLIDEDLHWIGDDQHLVANGDLMDRGVKDRPLMDLMRRLQRESAVAGGQVHVLLGNHETMNLMRDLRYVNPRSFAAWADEETDAERRDGWRTYRSAQRGGQSRKQMESDFNRDYPPGFFARLRSFDRDGEYGVWLLSLPAVIKINGVVFVHGGITVETASLGIDKINQGVRDDLIRHLEARGILLDRGLVTPLMDQAQIRQVSWAGVEPGSRAPKNLRRAAQEILDTAMGPLLGGSGPLWYRGNAFEDERIEQEMLDRSLELMNARAMVVAHSPTSSKRITSRFHGRLFKVDHNIGESDSLQALLVKGDKIVAIDATTHMTMMPIQELPTGKHLPRDPAVLSDRDLREFLGLAEIVKWRDLGRGSTRPRLLEMERNGAGQRGIFKSVQIDKTSDPEAVTDRYQHEMAAYRLDRALGLDMVPVTVLREIDGRMGSVQEWVEGAIDQEAAEAYELDIFESEDVARQLARSEIFDVLIGNHDRKQNDILCLVGSHRLYLIDHSKAFVTSTQIDWDKELALSADPEFIDAIERLDRHSLVQELGELISEEQIDALLVRRDKIVEQVRALRGP